MAPARSALRAKRRVALHREHDDGRARRLRDDLRDRLEAVVAGHVQVQDEHRRTVRPHVAPRVGDVAGLGDDLEVVVRVEQQTQAAPHDDVVVGDDDLDRIGAGARWHGRDDTVARRRCRAVCGKPARGTRAR